MSPATDLRAVAQSWNVLTSPWLEALDGSGRPQVISPLEALKNGGGLRCLAASSPLDLFAAHRFLLTLLYWKADEDGVESLRTQLLAGRVPRDIVAAIKAEAGCFGLFDARKPFLQDPAAKATKEADWKSAGSLFPEFASGTNIAHFHHGDDDQMQLCVACATVGMMRLVPWTQRGGRGMSATIHDAPPIMVIAQGRSLIQTLGLNLVPLPAPAGAPRWSGTFRPSSPSRPIPYLEAFTWNARRVLLPVPSQQGRCWRCGRAAGLVVGRIAYRGNDSTMKPKDGPGFVWREPAAFYYESTPSGKGKRGSKPPATVKSRDELQSTSGRDLAFLIDSERTPASLVVLANPGHRGWQLVVPCSKGDAKTFDHRAVSLPSAATDDIAAIVPKWPPPSPPAGPDGWQDPPRAPQPNGCARFVQTAAALLQPGDWAIVAAAAYRDLHASPAAFDVLTGLLWSLRNKVKGLPARNAAWLTLKLMAAAPPAHRSVGKASYGPVLALAKRQPQVTRGGVESPSQYPVSFPDGRRLEAELRRQIDHHFRQPKPPAVDWAGVCYALDQLLD